MKALTVDDLKMEIGSLHLAVVQRDRYIVELETEIANLRLLLNGKMNAPDPDAAGDRQLHAGR